MESRHSDDTDLLLRRVGSAVVFRGGSYALALLSEAFPGGATDHRAGADGPYRCACARSQAEAAGEHRGSLAQPSQPSEAEQRYEVRVASGGGGCLRDPAAADMLLSAKLLLPLVGAFSASFIQDNTLFWALAAGGAGYLLAWYLADGAYSGKACQDSPEPSGHRSICW